MSSARRPTLHKVLALLVHVTGELVINVYPNLGKLVFINLAVRADMRATMPASNR